MATPFTSYVWKEHHYKTKESWRLLFDNKKFTDVTLVCGDQKTIEAHRLILSACSPVFARILDQNNSSHPWIYLRGVDFEELKSIIEFIYLGASSLDSSKVNEFFEIAEDLEVSSIIKSQDCIQNDYNTELCQDVSVVASSVISSPPLEAAIIDEELELEDEEFNQIKSIFQDSNNLDDTFVDSYGVPIDEETINNQQARLKKEPLIRKHIQNRSKFFNCNVCSAKYASKGGVELHIKLKHGPFEITKGDKVQDEKENKRMDCKVNMNPESALETNKPSISDFYQADKNKFNCLICDFSLNTQQGVEKHIMDKHECQWEIFNCGNCNKAFTSQEQFKNHSYQCHSKVNTMCGDCDFEAQNILDLKQHTRTHHQATRFKCNLCKFRAPEKSVLKMHIMQVHIGKTFTCVRCNYSTKKKTQLKLHLKEAHFEDSESKSMQAITLDNENLLGLNQFN